MHTIARAAQTIAGAWILNVWFNRFEKDTGYRGGDATNMKEEFEVYGMSEKVMYGVGAVKVGLATSMILGNWVPKLARPASAGLAGIMVGAVGMHVKVSDPIKRAVPALTVLSLSLISALTRRDT